MVGVNKMAPRTGGRKSGAAERLPTRRGVGDGIEELDHLCSHRINGGGTDRPKTHDPTLIYHIEERCGDGRVIARPRGRVMERHRGAHRMIRQMPPHDAAVVLSSQGNPVERTAANTGCEWVEREVLPSRQR